MKSRMPISLRLALPPAVAALSVMFLAGLSLVDLTWGRKHSEDERDRERRSALEPPPKKDPVPITANVPETSEEEALWSLQERPGRGAAQRLWPLVAHREALFQLLLSKTTLHETRLYLLGQFDGAMPKKAREAARAIVAEKDLPEGVLLVSAFEVLSRHGGKEDLPLFAERQGESHQLKTLREEYRDQLQSQSR